MNKLNDSKESRSLKYILSTAAEVEKICSPLLKAHGIPYFTYTKIDGDGFLLRLTNHTKWAKTYFRERYYNDKSFYDYYLRQVPEGDKRSFLWIAHPYTPMRYSMYKHNLWNGISIYNRTPEGFEFAHFGAKTDNIELNNFYINNLEILENFINYFKVKAEKLIDPVDSSILVSSEIDVKSLSYRNKHQDTSIKNFLDDLTKVS